MFLDKSLNIALLISTLFHAAVFLPLPHLKNPPPKKSLPTLNVSYLAPKEISPRKPSKRDKPSTVVKYKVKKANALVKQKVNTPKLTSRDVKIEIPPELPKEKEALYLDYYQSIRARIRKFVVNNYPRYIACGEVCLYFVLSSDGKLKEIKVVKERANQNRQLKEVAKISLLQASPFLPFPKGLIQPQLSFNVVISFELEN